MTDWIPGYLGEIKLGVAGVDDLSPVANIISLNHSKAFLSKPHFGSQHMEGRGGIISGNVDASGHVTGGATNEVQKLYVHFLTEDPVDFEILLGDDAAITSDSGTVTGKLTMTSFSIQADAEDEWEWSFTGEFTEAFVYAAATP